MAADLGIKRCWYHSRASFAHYDIPKRQVTRIIEDSRVKVVSSRDILKIIKTGSL